MQMGLVTPGPGNAGSEHTPVQTHHNTAARVSRGPEAAPACGSWQQPGAAGGEECAMSQAKGTGRGSPGLGTGRGQGHGGGDFGAQPLRKVALKKK